MSSYFNPVPLPRGHQYRQHSSPEVWPGVLLLAGMAWLFWLQQLALFRGWATLSEGVSQFFGLPFGVTLSANPTLAVSVTTGLSLPSWNESLWYTSVLGLALAGVSWTRIVAVDNIPLRYFLRVLSCVLLLPLAIPLMTQWSPPALDLENHIAQVFKVQYWAMVITPLIYALTAAVLPGNSVKKAIICLTAMVYFFLSTPFLALFHVAALTLMGPAIVPFLMIFFTVLVYSIQLTAFYGWMASAD